MKASVATMSHGPSEEEQAAHEAAMVKKAEESGASISVTDKDGNKTVIQEAGEGKPAPDVTEGPQRPAEVPEKFWDADAGTVNTEALLKSYVELEKRLSAPKEEDKSTPPQEESASGEEVGLAAVREQAEQEFAEKGELSDEVYSALEKHGFDRAAVDQYIAGAQAVASERDAQVFSMAKIEPSDFKQAQEWASQNLSEEEIARFNAAVSAAPEAAAFAVKDLVSRYKSEANIEGSLTSGSRVSAGSHFRSKAEMIEAMSDKRYSTDAAFRAEVEQKVMRSAKLGINLYS